MRKICFLLTLMTMLTIGSYAQGGGVSGGFKAGLNMSDQKFTGYATSYNPDMRLGYHVGGFLSVMFSNTFGIQPELLFNSVGSKDDVLGVDAAARFNYLTLPVMFKVQPIPVLNFHAGPQVSTLLSAKVVTDDESEKIPDTSPIEFGVGVGAGLELPVGFVASVRYNVGLTDIYDDDNSKSETTNNYLQLSVGYKCFGKK